MALRPAQWAAIAAILSNRKINPDLLAAVEAEQAAAEAAQPRPSEPNEGTPLHKDEGHTATKFEDTQKMGAVSYVVRQPVGDWSWRDFASFISFYRAVQAVTRNESPTGRKWAIVKRREIPLTRSES